MVSIDGLAVEFGGDTLFSNVTFSINDGDRIALMGKNGAGKSTLLKNASNANIKFSWNKKFASQN